jgi:asparagine synthase (glutamine-hydrolysing)
MCGIFGILQSASKKTNPAVLEAASRVQSHRGPDSSNIATFEFEQSTLVFGHQRLSIIDLSHGGDQPMAYRDGKGTLIYNGELYNYLELRTELSLAGETFSTRSDTEVLLAALHRWGPERALERFNWMGAFAWLDRANGKLVLARDSGSEKPLYYFVGDNQFIFASEVKTLLTLSERKFSLDRDVIGQFIFQGLSDASPRTFLDGINQLEPGSVVQIPLKGNCYYVNPVHYTAPPYPGDPAIMSLGEFIEEVRDTFIDSVRVRLRSDVPVGVLLSGGVDSSSIAAVTQHLEGRENAPRLLSATSDDPRFDESRHIAAMERHLNQDSHRITIRATSDTLFADLATLNWHNDAPIAGLSALGHFRLMERARELGLTVILSGQGADEILLGYRKFLGFYLQSLVRHGQYLKAAAVLTRFIANRTIVNQVTLGAAKRYVPALQNTRKSSGKYGSETTIEGGWLQGWQSLQLGLGPGSLADRQMLDIRRYSVPSLCHYEDRMSMAMSREIRLPFLDSRMIDLLVRAPDDYKLRKGWTKYCFRKAMESMLPPEITWRRDKKGFSNPQGEWLKHELQEPVRDAFSANSLIAQKEIVDSKALLRKYDRYRRQPSQSGTIWYREIFAPLSLEIWMRQYKAWIA